MTWFRVDDGLPTNRKLLSIPRRDRMAAMGLWCVAGAWSSRELHDGFVPLYLLAEIGATTRQANLLTQAGFWIKVDGGWQFKDWQDWQPTRDDVLAKRKKTADKVREWRERNRVTRSEVTEGVTGLQDGYQPVSNPAPDPTRPVPKKKRTSSKTASGLDEEPRPEVIELCNHLADRIEENGSKRPEIGKSWRTACRLLIDKDGRTPEQIRKAIDWSQEDEFWHTNILSMPTLREKYDQLRLKWLADAKKKQDDRKHLQAVPDYETPPAPSPEDLPWAEA